MAILRKKEIREMSEEERKAKLYELNLELMKERGSVEVGGSIKSPGRIREIRKTIARILTIDNELKRRSLKGSRKNDKKKKEEKS